MPRKVKQPSAKTVEALHHRREEATRRNIPTAEYQSVLEKATQNPVRVAYDEVFDEDSPVAVIHELHDHKPNSSTSSPTLCLGQKRR